MRVDMKKLIILTISLFILASCGYKMAGFETADELGIKKTVFIKTVRNQTREPDVRSLLKSEIELYLSRLNVIKNEQEADYVMYAYLTDVTSSGNVRLSSGNSGSASMSLSLQVILKDKNGKTVSDKNYSASDSYDLTTSLSNNRTNWQNAFKRALRDSMNIFRNELK